MSLRITVEVMPHGKSDGAYMIGRMYVHNMKMHTNGTANYHIEMIDVSSMERGEDVTNSMTASFELKKFKRHEGMWALLAEAFAQWRRL